MSLSGVEGPGQTRNDHRGDRHARRATSSAGGLRSLRRRTVRLLHARHDYPGKGAREVKDAATARAMMLSAEWHQVYQKFHDEFVPVVLANGLIYRMEEANSFYHGGAVGASDTFTSSLWALDYLYWWADHNASGINFHTGEKVFPGGEAKPNVYTALSSSPDGFEVFPIGYAIKAFDLGSHGRLVPVGITSNSDNLNLTAYSVLASDGSCYVTLINKEYGPQGRSANVAISTGTAFHNGSVMFLSAPNGDITTVRGVLLGGSEIKEDGSWAGKWILLKAPSEQGLFTIELPAATAAVIKFSND